MQPEVINFNPIARQTDEREVAVEGSVFTHLGEELETEVLEKGLKYFGCTVCAK